MKKHFLKVYFVLTALVMTVNNVEAHDGAAIPLAGEWRYQLDPERVGRDELWFTRQLSGNVRLPGTLDQAGIGTPTVGATKGHLTRTHEYVGPAWYQTDLDIPVAWKGKTLVLTLERSLWRTTVWVGDHQIGTCDSLVAPHRYEIGPLKPGKHQLTIEVDNSVQHKIGVMGHSYGEETQSVWNGIVGQIVLEAHAPLRIDQVQVFPDANEKHAQLEVSLLNSKPGEPVETQVQAKIFDAQGKLVGQTQRSFSPIKRESVVSLDVPVTEPIRRWSEFSPVLYRAEVSLVGTEEKFATDFGFRKISTDGKQITLNGVPVFLRGTLDCAAYPLTGHPPMEVQEWLRLLGTIRSYGMNHVRYHSWCPPEAAFIAADRLGMMLHVETPIWVDEWIVQKTPGAKLLGQDPEVIDYIERELERILRHYGNHPSFCMFAIGNELASKSDYDKLATIIEKAKKNDPRHLYSVSTARKLSRADDYLVTHQAPGGRARGLFGPRADFDYTSALKGIDVPVIAHETGQWVVYPDFAQVDKYTGPLRARSLEGFRDQLKANGLAGMAKVFQAATGDRAWRLYKAEFEGMLATDRFGGFQLLGLSDFPGQQEALVGILDVFWDSKGLGTPKKFREFCSETVPLVRFPKYVWTNTETFIGQPMIAHFGPNDLKNVVCQWTLSEKKTAKIIHSGEYADVTLPRGKLTKLPSPIRIPLDKIKSPTQVVLTLNIKEDGGSIKDQDNDSPRTNSWDLWTFPAELSKPDFNSKDGPILVREWNAETEAAIKAGKDVLFVPAAGTKFEQALVSQFMPVYWSFVYFPNGPGSLGILCDPTHSALSGFPTESFADWQWFHMMQQSFAFKLNDLEANLNEFAKKLGHEKIEITPIVRVVDDFHRNQRLASIFETRIGKSRLLFCGYDLIDKQKTDSASAAMLQSLLRYMEDKTSPSKE